MSVPIELFRFFTEAPLEDAKHASKCIALMIAGREARIKSKPPAPTATPTRTAAATAKRSEHSITTLAATILRSVGEPMTAAQLTTEMMTRFRKVVSSPDAVRASLYKLSRKGKVFRQDGSRFALLEWATAPTPMDDQTTGAGP